MAKAFVKICNVLNRQSYDELEFMLEVGFYGSDVNDTGAIAGPHMLASGALAASQNTTQIHASIAAVVIAKASSLGLTVINGDVLMSSLAKV